MCVREREIKGAGDHKLTEAEKPSSEFSSSRNASVNNVQADGTGRRNEN